MTAQGAPYMSALGNFWDFLYDYGYFSQNFSWAFVSIHPMNVRTKFRSFTRSGDNRGTQKIWAVPGFAHAPSYQTILRALVRMHLMNVPTKLEVRSFTCS